MNTRIKSDEAEMEELPLSIDLSSKFPISRLVILKNTTPWLLGLVLVIALWIIAVTLTAQFPGSAIPFHALDDSFAMVSFLAVCLIFAKVFYEYLYLGSINYGIEANHFVISKGIILKRRGSFPLSRITDVYLDRTIGEFLFGLGSVHVSTPTAHSEQFAHIRGLRRATAIAFQHHLAGLLEATHSYVRESRGERATAPQREPSPRRTVARRDRIPLKRRTGSRGYAPIN